MDKVKEIAPGLMSNVVAYRLGLAALKLIRYPEKEIGDEIDRGLILCKLLAESGFKILETEKWIENAKNVDTVAM